MVGEHSFGEDPRSAFIQRLALQLFDAQGELLSLDEPPGARRTLAEAIAAEKGRLSVEDLRQHPALGVCADSLPAAACLGADLGGKGIVCVLSSVPRVWSVRDIATFEVLVSAVEPLRAPTESALSSLTAVADALPLLIWSARPNGSFDVLNHYWCEYTGQTRKDMLDWGWASLLHPDDRGIVACWREALRTKQPSLDLDLRLRRHDGEFRWHSFRAAPLFSAGSLVSWRGTFHEIDDHPSSELHKTKTLLSASLERENAIRADAERTTFERDELLAMLSHELRTPLSATLGWAQILRTGDLADTRLAPALACIERNSLRQAQLIDDLLDTSRVVGGQQIQRLEIDLRQVVESVVETFRAAALAKGIDLALRASRAAIRMQGDAARLEQVVNNLLSNAIKFTPRNGRVSVELQIFESDVLLRVRDNGRGISAEFLPRVFERFTQAERGTRQSQGGLGLGLAISERIVQLHGGTVTVESAGQQLGTCFTVRLPIGTVETAEPQVASTS